MATTRAPVSLGAAIRTVATYPDCYGEGRSVYLYNVDPKEFDRVYVVSDAHETSLPQPMLEELQADVIRL